MLAVRGDDHNVNLTMHHLVVYNNGEGRNGGDRNTAAATGAVVKGDYNKVYQLTIFNTSGPAQGPSRPKPSFASRSLQCVLLTPQVHPGSLYRCCEDT